MGGENKKHTLRPKISAKIVSYFLSIALIPPIVVSIVLLGGVRIELLQGATAKQQAIAADASHQVDSYLAENISQLSLTTRHYQASPGQIDQDLIALFKENPNLLKVEVLTKDDKKKRTATLQDDAIKITTASIASDDNTLDQLASKPKLVAVTRDLNNMPQITLGLPISTQSGPEGKVIGGIVGHYKVGALLPDAGSNDGYAYVVDESGNIVYHPDQIFLSTHADLQEVAAVRYYMGGKTGTEQTVSETNDNVVSAVQETKSGWGVVAEEPHLSVAGPGADGHRHGLAGLQKVAVLLQPLGKDHRLILTGRI